MKMGGLGMKEEGKGRDGVGGFGRTIVVGVEMDALSKELLTWALVKVAEPGDRVVAIHVLHRRELHDEDGKFSLLSHLKAFESVLSVYEDFCNLKKIDLKLKICRGSSARRVLVQQAKSISANIIVVGISRKSCTIGFSASVAKYCARKLPLECWVLVFRNQTNTTNIHDSQQHWHPQLCRDAELRYKLTWFCCFSDNKFIYEVSFAKLGECKAKYVYKKKTPTCKNLVLLTNNHASVIKPAG